MSLIHQLALTFMENVGPVTAKSMLAYAGSPEGVFTVPPHKLLRAPGFGEKRFEKIDFDGALRKAEKEAEFVTKNNVDVIFYTDPRYPKRLKACADSPILLYAQGKFDLNKQRVVSIIGTRSPTDYGRGLCKELVEDLQPYDVTVVSGLAYGIDVAAHKECLRLNLQTIGVVGHGMDRMYPATNKSTAEKMKQNGGVLSEFPSGTIPDRENFPTRNRIVAGLADATIVIEAGIKSGTLITAEIANSYNRDVFAFPGRIGDEFSEGCNFLIRNHKAALLTCAADVAYIMGWEKQEGQAKPANNQLSLAMDLNDEERHIVNILSKSPSTAIDDLTIQTGMPVSQLTMNLLNLEMQGVIRSMPGKMYAVN